MVKFNLNAFVVLIGILCFVQPMEASVSGIKQNDEAVDSIEVTKDFIRFPFSISGSDHKLILSQLKEGEDYTLYLSSDVIGDCRVSFVSNQEAIVLKNNVLRFNAKKPIFEIMLRKEDCARSVYLNLSIGCTSCRNESAQNNPPGIETDNSYSPEQLIRDVFIGGDCFDVDSSSINFIGHNLASGYFSSGSSSINIEEGVILSTGNINNSAGPNDAYNTGNSFSLNYVDADLADMVNSNSIYDVASVEFDFTPTTDQVSFEFVFASEEYCEYVNSTFNDVFGFFISGPGFNGPFSNNAENIAIIPNTNDYIAINSVNHLLNSNYYLNNIPSWQHAQIPDYLQCENHTSNSGIAIEDIEFDGFTTVMTVTADVVACETYHIKLSIADVADAYFDSAVFLKANSFSAGATANVSGQGPGGASSNIAYEDCQDGLFVFERVNDDLSDSMVVHFTYSALSTAIPGVDFEAFPDSIVIPAGDSIYYLTVEVLSDLLNEGIETLILELDAPCSCDIPFTELLINDYAEIVLNLEDLSFCGPTLTTLTPDVNGGIGDYIYSWSTNDSIEIIDVNPNTTTLYTLTVTDECGNTAETQSTIEIIEIPSATISGYEQVCPENPSAEFLIELLGEGPWEIIYSINGIPQPPISGVLASPYILNADELGVYLLNSVSHNGCEGDVLGAATVAPINFQIEAQIIEESCPETSDGSINITVSGGLSPYQFEWDNGAGSVEDPENLAEGTYNLTLTDANGCSTLSSIIVPLSDEVPVAEAGPNATLNCLISELTLNGSGSQGANINYLWTTNDGNILSGGSSLFPLVNQPGIYFLNITNTVNNCTVIDETEVFIDTVAPVPDIDVLGPLVLDCSNTSTILDGTGSTPFGVLNFEWTTNDGQIIPGNENIPNPEVNAAGTYQLAITNFVNGCSAATSFFIDADIDLPLIDIETPLILNCVDTIIQLDAGNSSIGAEFEYLWESNNGNIVIGDNTLFPFVDQPGLYTITIQNTFNHCENTAVIEVEEDIMAPIAEAGFPEELDCNNFLATLDGSQSSSGTFYNYFWTTFDGNIVSGASSLNPIVDATGSYFLSVLNNQNGCTSSDEVLVTENLNVPNGVEVEIFPPECFGDFGSVNVLAVFGGEGPFLYSIDGGENFYSNNFFSGLPSGEYNLIIQDAEGCQYEEYLSIPQVYELIVTVDLEAEIELGESSQLNAHINIPLNQIDTIIWSPDAFLSCVNCLNPTANPFENTIYTITVFDQNGCEASAEILLRVDVVRKIYIPNAFSPNADGNNDVFLIYSDEESVVKINRLQIFDRWGGKVFETFDISPNDPDFGWDGTMKDKMMNPSVFVYLAEIEFVDGVKILYSGDLTLMD